MTASPRYLVLIPSYNSGPLLRETVLDVLAVWGDVLVVIDGSTDHSADTLDGMAEQHPGLVVLRLARNRGKGAAVYAGALAAREAGFTHILTMDADRQHSPGAIPGFMAHSRARLDAMILGKPIFGPDAPLVRVWGRKLSNALAQWQTAGAIMDSLFGFRIYPIQPLLRVMAQSRFMRGFDFDPELAIRLCWEGIETQNVPTHVRYFTRRAGGISHFHYGRDNLRLTLMHVRLTGVWAARKLRDRL